jgi:hypothetical protein
MTQTPTVTIPPDVRAVVHQFIQNEIRGHFGDTPPNAEEEQRFLQAWLERGVDRVPLMDGSQVTIVGTPAPEHRAPAVNQRTQAKSGLKVVPVALIIAAAVVAGYFLVAPLWRDNVPTEEVGAAPTAAAESGAIPPAALPDGIDALVTSGEVRVPLVVPRTMEILVGGGVTGTTYVIVPVEVAEADWPCPQSDEKEAPPNACWVFGTVVNYLLGIPADAQSEGLADLLTAYGGTVKVRSSTGAVHRFEVTEVVEIGRQETEILAQREPAATIVLLGGPSSGRRVIRATYVDETLGGGRTPAPYPAEGVEKEQLVQLGERADLGAAALTPLSVSAGGTESGLVVLVENAGAAPLHLSPALVGAEDAAGRPLAVAGSASIPPGAQAQAAFTAAGEAAAWRITLSNNIVIITTQTLKE